MIESKEEFETEIKNVSEKLEEKLKEYWAQGRTVIMELWNEDWREVTRNQSVASFISKAKDIEKVAL